MPAPSELAIDRRAAVDRRQLDDTSWVDVVPGFVRDAGTELEVLQQTLAWERTEVLRYDVYVPERRLSAAVRAESRPVLRQTDLHLRATYRQPFTGVAAILYRNGEDFQGLHSDREMRWLDDTLIAIVVLGRRRPFVLRRRAPLSEVVERVPAGQAPGDIVLMPGEGDLLVMGGACQRNWLHGVPPADAAEPRISLTWRWTSRRGRPDTNPGYYDGKQYSDRPARPGSRSQRV
ncbi:MAG: alpha-ketoglutarate-dependent dioxygenase AlkB [Ilumatobacteraceae bacterium]